MSTFGPGRPSTKTPPRAPGVYRWLSRLTGKVLYVGETNNLRRRRGEHLRNPSSPWNEREHEFAWKASREGASSQERRAVERQKIRKHKPPHNQNGGGGGRRPKEP